MALRDVLRKVLMVPVAVTFGRHGGLGPELVVNGGFDADTDWAKGTGWTIAADVATHAFGVSSTIDQSRPLNERSRYTVTFTVSGRTTGSVAPRFGGGSAVVGTSRAADGTYTETLVADAGNNLITLSASTTFDGSIDNVSVREQY